MIPEIKSELSNGVLVLTLSRADKKNALTNDMYAALADSIERAGADQAVDVAPVVSDHEDGRPDQEATRCRSLPRSIASATTASSTP